MQFPGGARARPPRGVQAARRPVLYSRTASHARAAGRGAPRAGGGPGARYGGGGLALEWT